GFLMPSIFFKKAGINVTPVFTGRHSESVKALLDNKVSAAATFADMAKKHRELRVLTVTAKIPNEPIISRYSLAPEKRKAIIAAIQSLPNTPEGKQALASIADLAAFRPITAAAYRPMHELLLSEGKSVYNLVPQGWLIQQINQPFLVR
ncbi:MAG TPA: PhnD/SsuA/transferrin family substrate-binding protein, partial [Elusimicrobiales bacterium]|nr:PhnD/SsuA/transferrin family substrate-binding protein [Elusimicrobiales bacterium]